MAKQAATKTTTPVKPSKRKVSAVKTDKKPPAGWTKPFRAIGGYFAGAWVELRQVRWPNRRATWSLTLAVILFPLSLQLLF